MLHSWPSPGCLTSSSPSQEYFTSPIMSESPSSNDDVKAIPLGLHHPNGYYVAPQHHQEPFPYHSPPPRKTRKVSLPDYPMRQAELEDVGLVQSYHEYHEQRRRLQDHHHQQYLMNPGNENFPLDNATTLSRSFSTSLPNIASGSEFPMTPSSSSSSLSSSPMRYPADTRRYSLPVRSAPCVSSAPCILPSQMTAPDCSHHHQMASSFQAGNGCQQGERGRKRSVEELLQVVETPISDANSVDSLFASSSPSPNTNPLGSSAATMSSSSSHSTSVIQPVEQSSTFLSTLLERQAQLRMESQTTEEFDSERILRQSKQMRNKLRSILGRLKKTM